MMENFSLKLHINSNLLKEEGFEVEIDISKGSLLIDSGSGTIYHYTLIGDSNLELVRAELERLTADD